MIALVAARWWFANRRGVPRLAGTITLASGVLGLAILSHLLFAQQPAAPGAPPVAGEPGDTAVHPFRERIPAPSLDGGSEWFNTAGPLDLKELRGKFVLLDFWTYCCINCMHILPELKKLERAYPRELVVIGVHSAKFDAEHDSNNIREAILRYGIEHPVVNDANHVIWEKYFVSSWPSLRLIDPEGNLVGGQSGEVTFDALDQVFQRVLPYYRDHKLLDETPLHFDLEEQQAKQTPLRFPGKVLADEAGNRLFIADSSHNRIVLCRLDGTLIDVIGSGSAGRADGGFGDAQFDHPQGMALRGETLYVADTENHLLRKVDLKQKTVATIAGTGRQARTFIGIKEDEEPAADAHRFAGKPLMTPLNSPWDLLIHKDVLYIAMAGPHQIWRMPLDESEIALYAGNGREDIVDGPIHPRQPYQEGIASFAQPSGLATDGHALFVADSEGSSIRSVGFNASARAQTIIGTAHLPFNRLFTFGDVDGRGATARLQHPLGVVYHDGYLYLADTYNNKIKRIDVKRKTCETVAGTGEAGHDDQAPTFDEPGGITAAGGKLYIADTNNHRVRVVDLTSDNRVSTLAIAALKPPALADEAQARPLFDAAREVAVPPAEVKAVGGKLQLGIRIELPEGYKLNELAPMAYQASLASGSKGALVEPAYLDKPRRLEKPRQAFTLQVPLVAEAGETVLVVSLNYYYCREGAGGVCKMSSVAWKIPLRVRADAQMDQVTLIAGG
jgi:sugar lactone lactonase YvrE